MEAPEIQMDEVDLDGEAGIADACAAFLEDHSAYLDACLSEAESAAHESHAAVCPACARYADVMTRGLALVYALPDLEASPHFEERLRHRIFHLEDAATIERTGGRSMVGLAAAAIIALLAWSPVLMKSATQHAIATHTAQGSSSAAAVGVMTVAEGAVSPNELLTPSDGEGRPRWYVQPVSVQLEETPVHRFVGYVGSYSPLIVSPPAARGPRAVRLVSATSQ